MFHSFSILNKITQLYPFLFSCHENIHNSFPDGQPKSNFLDFDENLC